jgi:hypothetical protein
MTTMLPSLPSFSAVLLTLLTSVSASASQVPDPLTLLPNLLRPKPVTITAPTPLQEFAPGVQVAIGDRVVLTGSIIMDQGPTDGLEVLACLATGKTHESLVRLDAANGQLVKAAFIAALGLNDGVTAPESTGHPGRGTPLRVVIEWESLDAPGSWFAIDASSLVRERLTDQAYPALPFIYTGSRFLVIDETTPGGQPVRRERFMLDNTKSVIGMVDEPDALLASPSPAAGFDKHFEVYSAICPPPGTKVRLVFSKTTLPLTLSLDASGNLMADGTSLDDAALETLLAKHYGTGTTPNLRAVGVRVDEATPRDLDVAARQRLMAAAARTKAWVVPVYLLAKTP